ncbi:DNA-binding protein RHL1 isoform X2 [Syzygium oleosum]|uniref:DNA-binding protein RHL1 isoform X2 n=1 Tax=Syzygium oleosum TaxID=219896 RepID=UPI0024BAAF6C|nr:DNA-binding protein RHL1 isoform X2 [Syzygium oleosum]
MGRAPKSAGPNPSDGNPEAAERRRLKRLALARGALSEAPARCGAPLGPSKTALKHHGKDIVKRSQRKNRFLFSFPGLLAPIGGGKVGELKDLGTKNPVLYLDFPQGQMKLFGTVVFPENRYLTLQFSKGGKNVMCEDYFDNMIVFSDAWWIGKKDENPEEARLEFPEELIEGQHLEHDFQGGAGGSIADKLPRNRTAKKIAEDPQTPRSPPEDDASNDDNELKEPMEVTPIRHSERNMGKKLRYMEISSGDDSIGSDLGVADAEEEKIPGSLLAQSNIYHRDSVEMMEQSEDCSVLATKSKKQSVTSTTSKGTSHASHGSLVQATISTLFKKVEKKNGPEKQEKSRSVTVSGKKSRKTESKRKFDQSQEGWIKKRKVTRGKEISESWA